MVQFTQLFVDAKVVQIKVAGTLGQPCLTLVDFLSNERCAVTSMPAYWYPKRSPVHKPVTLLQMKMSHTKGK